MEIIFIFVETLEALERGGMVKDYNSNSTNLDSEDDEDPRTPASVSSQVKMINAEIRPSVLKIFLTILVRNISQIRNIFGKH